MSQPEDWDGFPIRLGRAIDRWPGGGQRKFAEALKAHAERHGLTIPTSSRTVVNYLSADTRPSAAWIDAAATVLGQSSEWLLSGVTASMAERPNDWAGITIEYSVTPEGLPRARSLVHLIVGGYPDLPWEACMIMHGVASYFFGADTEGWDDQERRRADVEEFVRRYFGPLRQPSTAKMGEAAVMALTASLAASAYLQLDAEKVIQNKRGIDPADVLADLKRRQPPEELDVPDLARRIAKQEKPHA
jgi:hypothetical protein